MNIDKFLSLDIMDCDYNEGFLLKHDNNLIKLFAGDCFKTMSPMDENFIRDKIKTVELLDKNRKYLPEEYVIPDSILSVDGEQIGIIEPFIKGKSLRSIFYDEEYPLDKKISYMKKIGDLLYKMNYLRENGVSNLYIGDIHSGNFIIDRNKNLKVVDLDSSRIGDGPVYPAIHLIEGSIARNKPTYRYTRDGLVIPDRNSDLHGYHMMIMEMLFDDDIYYDEEAFDRNLDILKKTGIDKRFIDSFERLTSPYDNTNPKNLLDCIDYKIYSKCKKNNSMYY